MLASTLVARLNKVGSCTTIINNQLKTVDDFSLTVQSITLNGSLATAGVQTVYDGKKVSSKVMLKHESAGWRVASLGAL